MQSIELRDLYVAKHAISAYVRRTPLVHSPTLSGKTGGEVYLKLENLQETGAFKVRGAANRLLQMSVEERARGVIAFSTGNHGRALAWVGKQMGVRVVVCVPEEPTLADSLVGGIGLDNHYTFELVRRVVDEMVVVSEEEIAHAMVYALKSEKLVVEGGGAVALAALLAGQINVASKCVACVVSGGYVDMGVLTYSVAEEDSAGAKA